MTGKGRTVLGAIAALSVMTALVCYSVPLYNLFCKATGAGGTPRRVEDASAATVQSRTIEIRFETSVMQGMPWRFKPEQARMVVKLGEPTLAKFTAENLSDQPITGTAVFNVSPAKAAEFVNKIQCFCFSEQHLEPGQKAELPVTFYIDPAIADNPDTNDVHSITLSYAFFRASDSAQPQVKSEATPLIKLKQPNEGPS